MERQSDQEPQYRREFREYLLREFGIGDRKKQDMAMALFEESFLQKVREAGILGPELKEPLYQIMIGPQPDEVDEHWLPIREAGIAYDSGWVFVRIGGLVMEGIGQRRPITDEERSQISDIADEYSASK